MADRLRTKGQEDLLWRLGHLRTFGKKPLDQITVQDVDNFRRAKVKEATLSPGSINKCISCLSSVLEQAVEYELIPRNVAKGRKRRLKVTAPRRSYLDRAEHIQALLDAAGAMDAADGRRSLPWRRTLLSVLTFAGLRLDECLSLRWADVDLAGGRLKVKGTKTAAAARTVKLLPVLRDELLAYAAAFGERQPNGLVFPTQRVGGRYAGGAKHTPSNIRNRVLAPAVGAANARLAKEDVEPLPEGLTPHSLRRTFASILVALNRDLAVIMRQMGHAGPEMTLGVYAAGRGARAPAGPRRGSPGRTVSGQNGGRGDRGHTPAAGRLSGGIPLLAGGSR